MAISKYTENGQEFWQVYIHVRCKSSDKRIQKRVKRIETEADARREEKKLIRELSMKAQKLDGFGMTWEDIIYLWWEDVKAGYMGRITERSAAGYFSIVQKWTRPWYKLPASQLTRADGRTLIMRLEKAGLKRVYQKKIKNIINKVYDWGVEFKYIVGNTEPPMRGMIIDIKEEKAPDILSLEEIKKFLTAAQALDHHWYPIWAFAILTGMRSGELHALSWEQIDLEKNIIMVDRSYDSNSKTQGPTKGRYWRTVPINDNLRKLIMDLKRRPEVVNSGFVLPRSKDWDNGDQAVPLRNFLKSIKVKSIKFHALRACFATQMLANGVSAPVVMKIGGWKKSSTMDIYLRLAGVDTKGATDCLEFIPSDISFGDNVVNLFEAKNQRNS